MKYKINFLLIIFLIIMPYKSEAQGTSGIDFTEIINAIEQVYGIENTNLPEINSHMKDTNTTLQNDLQGNFGYGKLDEDVDKRLWSNDSWIDVLSMQSGGNTSGFANAQKNYANLYQPLNSGQIDAAFKNNNIESNRYQQAGNINRAALAASSYSYDELNTHIKNVHDILSKLDSEPSEKAAVDLNARLIAEVAFIQLDMLKQENIQTQILATQSQAEVNGMTNQAKFMEWNPG